MDIIRDISLVDDMFIDIEPAEIPNSNFRMDMELKR